MTIRILLADDHALVRAGIRALLERIPGFEVVAEAADGREAIALVAEHRPEVALINISMPELNGLEAAARIASAHPHTRVVMLSLHADEEYVRRALSHGAAGYLVKSADAAELELAIRAASRGDVWLSPSVSRSVVRSMLEKSAPDEPFEILTPRQREVLQLVAEGLTNREIGARLDVSVKTVDTHRTSLMRKLDLHDAQALTRLAIRRGLVSA